jgi:hypothetical protein
VASELSKFTLRIPTELLQKLRIIAENHGRSVNKEIEMVIKEYIKQNIEI